MRTVTVDYKVYKYNELDESAKEKVKSWYLETQDSYGFSEMVKEDLKCLFGTEKLPYIKR